MSNPVGLRYLFSSFFQIGLYSFGGYMALISTLQEKLVGRDKVIKESIILDGLSIASLLPGPVAVNVVTYVGYTLRGWMGALISMTAVLLPSFFFMIGIAELSNRYMDLPLVYSFLAGVIPVIIAIIARISFQMGGNYLKNKWQIFVAISVFVFSLYSNSYFSILAMIIVGGLFGFFASKIEIRESSHVISGVKPGLVIGLISIILFFIGIFFVFEGELKVIFSVFTKVSLTLFGGGYVMIPSLHDIVVEQYHWLSAEEFSKAIAYGQITPGPILVTSTFIGYQVSGFLGAILATIGIFVPSATLMVLVGSGFLQIRNHPIVEKIVSGIRPVVIGLMAYSVVLLLLDTNSLLVSLLISLLAFILITFAKFNFFWVLLVSGLAGLFIF